MDGDVGLTGAMQGHDGVASYSWLGGLDPIPIDWRSTILRSSALALSLGAWVGIVLVVRQLLG